MISWQRTTHVQSEFWSKATASAHRRRCSWYRTPIVSASLYLRRTVASGGGAWRDFEDFSRERNTRAFRLNHPRARPRWNVRTLVFPFSFHYRFKIIQSSQNLPLERLAGPLRSGWHKGTSLILIRFGSSSAVSSLTNLPLWTTMMASEVADFPGARPINADAASNFWLAVATPTRDRAQWMKK